MSTRDELLKQLKTEFEKKEFWEDYDDIFSSDIKFTPEFLNNAKYVKSDFQIERMITLMRTCNFNSADEAFTRFKQEGLLSVQPTLIEGKRDIIPSLILSWGNYLHWFRGYHFQISNTEDGIGEVYSGADRLDHALHTLRHLDYVDDNTFEQAKRCVFTASMIPVLLHFSNGYQLLENNPELINSFLDLSGSAARLGSVSLDDFMKYVTVNEYRRKPSFPGDIVGTNDYDKAVMITCHNYGYGLLTFGKDNITFTTCIKNGSYRTLQLKMPEWLSLKYEDGDFIITNPKQIVRIMVRALMTLAGFRADWMVMYPIGTKRGDLGRIEYNVPESASNWEEIEKYIKVFANSL